MKIPPRWKAQVAALAGDDALGERRKPKRPRRTSRVTPAVPTEEAEQLELAMWLDVRGHAWCHVPNGELRHPRTAMRLRAMGVKAGVPDILVFTPPPKYPASRGAALELKRRNVRRPTPHQAAWLAELGTLGWCVRVCSGAAEAIAFLRGLGY